MTAATVELTEEALAFLQEHVYEFDRDRDRFGYTMPWSALAYTSVAALRADVNSSGSHFFSPGTMRYWKSRVAPSLIGSRFFITSEKMDHYPRIYTVRWVTKTDYGSGNLQCSIYRFEANFDSLDKAKRFARKAHDLIPFPALDTEA